MRVNKYAVELDNGQVVNLSSMTSEQKARECIERQIENGNPRYEGATQVTAVRLTARGRWG